MFTKCLLFILGLFLLSNLSAQEHLNHDHDHDHKKSHSHIHEIGVSAGPVYFVKANEFYLATHLHYVYNFPGTKFGLGLGYEYVFDEHKHNFVGLELNYHPVHQLTLNVSPGIAFEGEHTDEKDFALHFETVYEFEFGVFHIGPVLELAWHPEDFHIGLGLHVGLGL